MLGHGQLMMFLMINHKLRNYVLNLHPKKIAKNSKRSLKNHVSTIQLYLQSLKVKKKKNKQNKQRLKKNNDNQN